MLQRITVFATFFLALVTLPVAGAEFDGVVSESDASTPKFDLTWQKHEMGMIGSSATGGFYSGSNWTKFDSNGNLYFASEIPRNLYNNNHGKKESNPHDWEMNNRQKFLDLQGSDRAEFAVFCDDDNRNEIMLGTLDLDYPRQKKGKYRSQGTHDGKDGTPVIDNELATTDPSLGHDFENTVSLGFPAGLNVAESSSVNDGSTNWAIEETWEIKIDSIWRENSVFKSRRGSSLHGSSNQSKLSGDLRWEGQPLINKVDPENPTGADPSSLAIFSAAWFAAFCMIRRRRRRVVLPNSN